MMEEEGGSSAGNSPEVEVPVEIDVTNPSYVQPDLSSDSLLAKCMMMVCGFCLLSTNRSVSGYY
jgi:hypothetical protein